MGDFIRYILTRRVTLERVAQRCHKLDPEFTILVDQAAPNMGDVLLAGGVRRGELNRPEDQVFDED